MRDFLVLFPLFISQFYSRFFFSPSFVRWICSFLLWFFVQLMIAIRMFCLASICYFFFLFSFSGLPRCFLSCIVIRKHFSILPTKQYFFCSLPFCFFFVFVQCCLTLYSYSLERVFFSLWLECVCVCVFGEKRMKRKETKIGGEIKVGKDVCV